jgi:hypothetical protein
MVVRRGYLKPAEAPAPKAETPRCGSCGVRIPQLNHRPFRCSYCVGDPFFGKDGYLLEMINEALAGELPPARRVALLACLGAARSSERRRYFKMSGLRDEG